jgi:two-component system, NtrC family, response regulator HydG
MKKKDSEHILIADDSRENLQTIHDILKPRGYKISSAIGTFETIRVLDSTTVDLVVLDIKMPESTGLNLIKYIREKFIDTEIVVITESDTLQNAAQVETLGTEEYLHKPFTSKKLLAAVKRARDKRAMRVTMKELLEKPHLSPFGIIGRSEPIKKILKAIEKTAAVSATVIISGESGTGKELVARAIHYYSSRASAPFVTVNCGSIPESLLESELFGHVKGAFTGAFETRLGFFQTADVGTIFLDEISETSLAMQVKLLRVLQEKELYMVGSRKPQKIDVRILASTNKDLSRLVNEGSFREDLYYRLNVVNIHLPPLRTREGDIPLLTQYFASRFAKETNRPVPRFSDTALKILEQYKWPGNVRELENVIYRLLIMNESPVIDVRELRTLMGVPLLSNPAVPRTLAAVEADYIRQVLAMVDNNKTQAAKILGIDRKTLREKLK